MLVKRVPVMCACVKDGKKKPPKDVNIRAGQRYVCVERRRRDDEVETIGSRVRPHPTHGGRIDNGRTTILKRRGRDTAGHVQFFFFHLIKYFIETSRDRLYVTCTRIKCIGFYFTAKKKKIVKFRIVLLAVAPLCSIIITTPSA